MSRSTTSITPQTDSIIISRVQNLHVEIQKTMQVSRHKSVLHYQHQNLDKVQYTFRHQPSVLKKPSSSLVKISSITSMIASLPDHKLVNPS